MKCQWRFESWGRAVRVLGVLAAASLWAACAGTSGADAPSTPKAPDTATAGEERIPFPLDREKLAGLGLSEYPPMPDEEVIEGGAGNRGKIFFSGDELVVGVWEADAAILAIREPLAYDEFVTILSGKLILTDNQGVATEYLPGESVVVPKGFVGTWEMLGNFREIYVLEKAAFVRAAYGE
jgi:hypothetical protein